MKPEQLELKLRQCMRPGLPSYLKQLHILTGQQERVSIETFERYVRDVKCVYWRKIEGKKVYFIDALPVEPCVFAKFHDWMKGVFGG